MRAIASNVTSELLSYNVGCNFEQRGRSLPRVQLVIGRARPVTIIREPKSFRRRDASIAARIDRRRAPARQLSHVAATVDAVRSSRVAAEKLSKRARRHVEALVLFETAHAE